MAASASPGAQHACLDGNTPDTNQSSAKPEQWAQRSASPAQSPRRKPTPHAVVVALLLLLLALVGPGLGAKKPPVVASQVPAMWRLNASFPVTRGTWQANASCSDWLGVTCDSNGYVVQIALSLKGLPQPGTLPSEIGNLTTLTGLRITSGLPSPLPASLSLLTALKLLDLTGNALSTPLAQALPFRSLASLTTLSLNFNQLSGPIPAALSSCTGLANLLIGDNLLSGPIPDIFPPLTGLQALDLGNNSLVGPVPASVTALPQLYYLDLSSNLLAGTAPAMFVSPYIGTVDGTYRIQSNFFGGSAVPYYANRSRFFCPNLQQGGYAVVHLSSYGSSFLSSQGRNCLGFSGSSNASSSNSNDPFAALGNCSVGASAFLNSSRSSDDDSSYSGFSGYSGSSNSSSNYTCGGSNGNSNSNSNSSCWRSSRRWRDLDGGQSGGYLGSSWGRGRCKISKANGTACGAVTASQGFLEPQRLPQLCASFCNALDGRGPCAGQGYCYLNTTTSTGSSSSNSSGGAYAQMWRPTCNCTAAGSLATYANSTGASGIDNSTAKAVPYFATCVATLANVYNPPQPSSTNPTGVYSTGLQVDDSRASNSSSSGAAPPPSKFNRWFRHLSLGFTGSYAAPAWAFPNATDWRRSNAVGSVKDQGKCGACWAFTAVGAVESALAIANSTAPLDLAEQQVLDCQGTWNCSGGVPSDALNYLAYTSPGLTTEAFYPYNATKGTCKVATSAVRLLLSRWRGRSLLKGSSPSGTWRASHRAPRVQGRLLATQPYYMAQMHEQGSYGGWFGILLTVQAQPAIVDLEADQPSFLSYPGGFVYSDPGCFANQVLTHSLLVVGYDLTAPVPFWVLKNSWGTNWGEAGYMRLAIAGGLGVCGVNYSPARYPVVRGASGCGPINPCGSGTCTPTPTGLSNTCSNCPSNFMPVTNLDGSQSCAPVLVCNLFASNPCGVGTCVNDGVGGFSCICPPPSYTPGLTTSGAPTCIPGKTSGNLTLRAGMTCDLIRTTYGLSKAAFATLNPAVNCSSLAQGTQLNVSNPGYTGCQLYYPIAQSDSCGSIESLFNVSLATLNPDLNCSALALGQQVCVQAGVPVVYLCTQLYPVSPGDTCSSIALGVANPPLTPQLFYAYNPGIICNNLTPAPSASGTVPATSMFGAQVCVSSLDALDVSQLLGATSCTYGTLSVLAADTCAKLYTKWYCSKPSLFLKYNGWSCVDSKLYAGQVLCKPPSSCT